MADLSGIFNPNDPRNQNIPSFSTGANNWSSFSGGSSGNKWVDALGLASQVLGGGSSKGGGSSNVEQGGYLNQAKKEARKDANMKKVFDNFSIYEPSWEPQSNPQQFAQQYASGMSGGGGGSSSGGNKIGSALGGAASGAQIGTMIAPGIGTAIGAGLGAIGGFFCDVRLKTDIAPLERSDVHDELADMAFLVKEIRECA
jgi:hypothetical protein